MRDPTRVMRRRRQGYLARHWRGELDLPASLGLNYLLPAALTALVLGALSIWVAIGGGGLRAAAAAYLLAWPAAVALEVWGAVGAWRAAGQESRPRMLAARAAIALAAAATASTAFVQHGPAMPVALALASGADPAGQADIALSADGRRLRLGGHIGLGDADRVIALAGSASGVRLLELDASGARWDEARRLATWLAPQGWLTRVTGRCDQACTPVFLAGRTRQLMPSGRLGLNRAGGQQRAWHLDRIGRAWFASRLRDAGLPPTFVRKAMVTAPPLVWHPGRDELVRDHVVTQPARPLDAELPADPGVTAADDADALNANPLWHALDSRFAGTIDDAVQRLAEARAAGSRGDALQVAAQRAVEPRLPKLLDNAGPELREQYARLLVAQIDATPDPDACRALLGGDAAVRRQLPAALAEREAAWLQDAIAEPAGGGNSRRASTLEFEVIRRAIGPSAPTALAQLRRPGERDARACAKAGALLASLLALPQAERKLALRLAFSDP